MKTHSRVSVSRDTSSVTTERLAEVSLIELAQMTMPEIHHVSLGVRQLFSAVNTTQSKVMWCPGGILGLKRVAV